ncbi:hypothetical protein [Promicromonospora kroppenstedtii]|uniref:hypothetical protein n=1 Tax=Promicromonospora kroppenstedtii TaxID=440482 RepID=UPI0004BA73CB|nr:hypothetical protein [Promicromonospora kroppenstedtii]
MSEQTMNFTKADYEAAIAVLGRAEEGKPVGIVNLTDEQVMVLDGVHAVQPTPMPWLETQGEIDKELVGKVALRALLGQGYVVPASRGEGQEVGIDAIPELTGTLVLRRTPQAILSIERVTSLGRHWVFCYLHEGYGILEEEVATSGHHTFSVYPEAFLGERLEKFLDPTSAAIMAGKPRTFTVPEFEAAGPTLPELSEALTVCVLSAVKVNDDMVRNVTVYSGPRGVFTLQGDVRDGVDDHLVLTEVGAGVVRGLPGKLLAA